MDRLLNMILRQVMRRLVKRSVDAGFDAVEQRDTAQAAGPRRQGNQARMAAHQTRRATKLASRLSRM